MGAQASVGRSLGLAVTHWVGRYCHELSSSFAQVGGERWLPRTLEANRASSAAGMPCQHARWPRRATSLLPICLGTKCSQTATGAKLPADTSVQQTRLRAGCRALPAPHLGLQAGSAARSACTTGELEHEEPGFSHPKVPFQRRVQVLTWDQELLGNPGTPGLDTEERGENAPRAGL